MCYLGSQFCVGQFAWVENRPPFGLPLAFYLRFDSDGEILKQPNRSWASVRSTKIEIKLEEAKHKSNYWCIIPCQAQKNYRKETESFEYKFSPLPVTFGSGRFSGRPAFVFGTVVSLHLDFQWSRPSLWLSPNQYLWDDLVYKKKVSHGKIRNIFHTYLKMTRSFRERPGNAHENIDSTIRLRYLYGCSLGRLKIFQEWFRQTRSSPCNNTAERLPLECSHFHELDHIRRTSWSSE